MINFTKVHGKHFLNIELHHNYHIFGVINFKTKFSPYIHFAQLSALALSDAHRGSCWLLVGFYALCVRVCRGGEGRVKACGGVFVL